jgi:threonine dehydrogenase-like Zn-dependent dehydrogenase
MRAASTKKTDSGLEELVAPTRISVPSKMTAAVLYGSEDLRIEQIDVPSLAADEVLLRVRLALTDGTDLKVWKRGYHAKMIQPPAVFGHEVVGEIVATGKRVDAKWRLGTRVIAANSAPCFRCYHCRRGQENLCDDLLFNNGAYAEYMRIPGRIVRENMLEVPHSVDDHSAAFVEPLACVLRGIHEMEVRTGDTAAVIGCGPIGLKYVRMLSRRGVRVIALARPARSSAKAGSGGHHQCDGDTRRGRGSERLDGRTAWARLCGRGGGESRDVAAGFEDGTPRRRGELLQRIAVRDARGDRAGGDSLFRDQDDFAVPPYATLHS